MEEWLVVEAPSARKCIVYFKALQLLHKITKVSPFHLHALGKCRGMVIDRSSENQAHQLS